MNIKFIFKLYIYYIKIVYDDDDDIRFIKH